MQRIRSATVIASVLALLTGCGTTPAVKYQYKPPGDGSGYRFVIPRTVVKVSQGKPSATDKSSQTAMQGQDPWNWPATPNATHDTAMAAPRSSGSPAQVSFTPVPVSYDQSGKTFSIYSVTDDTSGWSLVSTAITNVKYADYLIVQSLGTQVTGTIAKMRSTRS